MIRRNRNKNPEPTPASEPFTYIHRGTTLTGDLEASGRVRVHGTIRGNVHVKGVLEVAEAGIIEGDLIEADEVKIIGRVHASVHAKGKYRDLEGRTTRGGCESCCPRYRRGGIVYRAQRDERSGRAPGSVAARLGAGVGTQHLDQRKPRGKRTGGLMVLVTGQRQYRDTAA